MIKIERRSPPPDTILDKNKAKEYRKIEQQIAIWRGTAEPQTLKFNGDLWSASDVKECLHKSQHGKCCYCERRRDRKIESDVEHFRPKGKVAGHDKHPGDLISLWGCSFPAWRT